MKGRTSRRGRCGCRRSHWLWAVCWLASLPWILDAPLSAAAAAILNTPSELSLAVWHGVSPALMLSALTLLGVAVAYMARDAIRRRAWRPAHGTEQLYTGTLALLNAISRVIAPPLHSASLRSYVMVIVVTTSSWWGPPSSRCRDLARSPRDERAPHELLIVVAVVAGAIAATLAKSTMAAVLSLGVVGYGVATTFLLFGAPDLAMTQFSVETLTVVIYVLVFRHFRNLGALSPRARPLPGRVDRCRRSGHSLGGLVLSVSTTETAPRLREYFADFGPTLGHGRNIVNVILVDFRGFDTMGEITVLATAAIGVRALLRLAAAERAEVESTREPPLTSPIFRTAARLLMPLLLLFAVFLLLRGHNEPGGGFVGGLVAAAAFALYAIAYGVDRARQALLVKPLTLLGVGLLIALASGVPAALRGQPFMTAQWASRTRGPRYPRAVRHRRVSRGRGRGADDDFQPCRGVLSGSPARTRVGHPLRRRHLPDAPPPAGAADHRPWFAVERYRIC